MATNKTTQTATSVTDFLDAVADEKKRTDCFRLAALLNEQTGFEPVLWGSSIVGFGSYHYRYESGREGDAPLVGFSPRKEALVLYLAADFEQKEALLQQLGKHKTGQGCVYFKKLEDIRIEVLNDLVANSVDSLKRTNRM
ncbi:hypothetical protein GCM10027299_01830 [Larkinella ripae]